MVCALGKLHSPIPDFKKCRMLPGLIPSNYILRFNMFNLGSREAVQCKSSQAYCVSLYIISSASYICFLGLVWYYSKV